MTFKILKIIFETFLILTDHKFNFVNCKSVSVMTGLFFSTEPKLNCLAVLSCNYWLYDFNPIRFQKKVKFLFVFVSLVLLLFHPIFTILSHYPYTNNEH